MLRPCLRAPAHEVERVQPLDLARDLTQQADERQAPAELGNREVKTHIQYREVLKALLSDDGVSGLEDLVDLCADLRPLRIVVAAGTELSGPAGGALRGRRFEHDADLEQVLGILGR